MIPKRARTLTRLSSDALVQLTALPDSPGFGAVIAPCAPLSAAPWVAAARPFVEAQLLTHSALLFRGFAIDDPAAFRSFAAALRGPLSDYSERAAPRRQIAPGVFTSTEFAADQVIPLHHEMSYAHSYPGWIWFYCARPPEQGGATPLASERCVTKALPAAIRRRLIERQVLYTRNYGEGIDMTWQEAFQTEKRAQVEAYCRRAGIDYEWRSEDRLRTRSVRPAQIAHPQTREALWFNHAAIFHESNLPADVRLALRDQFAADEMPRNAFYGDGAALEDEVLATIRDTYEAHAVRFHWQHGDVLLVDNFLAAHGRDAFAGPRSILVAMVRPAVHEMGRDNRHE